MADEITGIVTVNLNKDPFQLQYNKSFSIDQTGTGGGNPGIINVGTGTSEVISFGDIGTAGLCFMQNLEVDVNNYVSWGPESASVMVPVGRLAADAEPTLWRVEPGITLRMKATGDTCKVFVAVLEN